MEGNSLLTISKAIAEEELGTVSFDETGYYPFFSLADFKSGTTLTLKDIEKYISIDFHIKYSDFSKSWLP